MKNLAGDPEPIEHRHTVIVILMLNHNKKKHLTVSFYTILLWFQKFIQWLLILQLLALYAHKMMSCVCGLWFTGDFLKCIWMKQISLIPDEFKFSSAIKLYKTADFRRESKLLTHRHSILFAFLSSSSTNVFLVLLHIIAVILVFMSDSGANRYLESI